MMNISPEAIDELNGIPWFSNCGKPNANLSSQHRQLSSWEEVRLACESPEWIEVTEEAQGALTEYLSEKYPADYQGVWNKLVRDARVQVDSTAGAKAAEVAIEQGLGNGFVDAVKWDVLNGIMEVTYKSKNPPVFFENLLNVYRLGHYPCGLDADGRLVFF
jgi:hypothetical protein